jgi:hypothetical protein
LGCTPGGQGGRRHGGCRMPTLGRSTPRWVGSRCRSTRTARSISRCPWMDALVRRTNEASRAHTRPREGDDLATGCCNAAAQQRLQKESSFKSQCCCGFPPWSTGGPARRSPCSGFLPVDWMPKGTSRPRGIARCLEQAKRISALTPAGGSQPTRSLWGTYADRAGGIKQLTRVQCIHGLHSILPPLVDVCPLLDKGDHTFVFAELLH